MKKGFLDQIVLSEEKIDILFKQDFPVVKKWIDNIISTFQVDYFTFYTKWYTNGIFSKESFFKNHPEVINIRSENRLFRKTVDYLHSKNIEVGCMLHLLIWEKETWGNEAVLGNENRLKNIVPENIELVMIDPLHSLSKGRIKKLVEEHLTIFPEIDHLLFETEIVNCNLLKEPYDQWAVLNEKPLFETLSPIPSNFSFQGPSIVNNQSFMEFTSFYERTLLEAINKTVKEFNFKGELGYVYQTNRGQYNPLEIVTDPDWWILPWYYFGWGEPATQQKIDDLKLFLTSLYQQHRKVWYIGDAAIAVDTPSIEDMFEFCRASGFKRYMACGTPVPNMGLRWLGIDNERLRKANRLYKRLYSGS
ncbi:MAG: hypothetical protein PHH77_05065 [Victivallaceae bacterium]|nr:hypothetical protein [Victivallaceae bacterium]